MPPSYRPKAPWLDKSYYLSGTLNYIRVNHPLASAHLGLHAAIVIHRDRDAAFDLRQFPTCGQNIADDLLAALSGNLQLKSFYLSGT